MTEQIIKLPNVRISYPTLWQPRAFNDDQAAKYSCNFLIDTKTEEGRTTIRNIEAAIKQMAEEKWGKGKIPKALKPCLNDGNEKDAGGYEDMMFLSASNTADRKPKVVMKVDGMNVEAGPDDIRAGYYVNATVTLWAQDNQWGKRINANLRAIQLKAKGETFGAAPVDADDEFDDFEDDDDDII